MINFGFPYAFLLAFLILFLWWKFSYKKLWQPFPNPILQKFAKTPFFLKIIWFFRFIIAFLIAGILANPSITRTYNESKIETHNTIIVLDLSRSMLAEDLTPSRMQVAKNSLQNFVNSRKNDNFGLVVFAGKTFTLASNSRDIIGISGLIDTLSPDYIRQEKPWLSGTNIGDALLLAMTEIEKTQWEKSILLVTDGSANIGSNPEKIAEIIASKNIKIYSIGIGTKRGEPLSFTNLNGQKTYFYDANGEKIKSDLDDIMLTKISEKTNGKYFAAENISLLTKAFNETNSAIGEKFYTEKITKKTNIMILFGILAIIFILLEQFLYKKFLQKYQILAK